MWNLTHLLQLLFLYRASFKGHFLKNWPSDHNLGQNILATLPFISAVHAKPPPPSYNAELWRKISQNRHRYTHGELKNNLSIVDGGRGFGWEIFLSKFAKIIDVAKYFVQGCVKQKLCLLSIFWKNLFIKTVFCGVLDIYITIWGEQSAFYMIMS